VAVAKREASRAKQDKLRTDFDSYPEVEKLLPKVRYILGQAAGHEGEANELETKLKQLKILVAGRND
jgi:hypothetical protein